jgi:hypothetical protein
VSGFRGSPDFVPRPTTRQAQWDYDAFITRYPIFGQPNANGITLEDENLEAMWDDAEIFLDNTSLSQVRDLRMRQRLLFMLVAHMATLQGWPDNYPAGKIAGQMTSVSEGSVSLGIQPLLAQPATALATWLAQTQYGAEYYAAITAYRMARYIRGRQPYLGVGPRYFPYSSRWW